jgi:hypothetical protein
MSRTTRLWIGGEVTETTKVKGGSKMVKMFEQDAKKSATDEAYGKGIRLHGDRGQGGCIQRLGLWVATTGESFAISNPNQV